MGNLNENGCTVQWFPRVYALPVGDIHVGVVCRGELTPMSRVNGGAVANGRSSHAFREQL